jgi:hypothetical protein
MALVRVRKRAREDDLNGVYSCAATWVLDSSWYVSDLTRENPLLIVVAIYRMPPKQSTSALGQVRATWRIEDSILRLNQDGTVGVYIVIEGKLINFQLFYTKSEHVVTTPNSALICPDNALPLFAACDEIPTTQSQRRSATNLTWLTIKLDHAAVKSLFSYIHAWLPPTEISKSAVFHITLTPHS